jgi:hypothetical protein
VTTTDPATEIERLQSILREIENLRFQIRDTPLISILGFSEMMANEIQGPLSLEYREHAKNIHTSAEIIYDIILEMRDLILEAFPEQRSRRRLDELQGLISVISSLTLSESPALWMRIAATNKRVSRWLGVELRDYLGKPSDAALLVPDGWKLDIKEITSGRYLVTVEKEDAVFTSNLGGRMPNGMNLPAAICVAALQAILAS